MALCLSYLVAAFLALILQRLTTKQHAQNFFWADLSAIYVGAFFQSVFLVLTIRPLVALIFTFLTLFILAITNWAKQKALRDEPLLFSDITLLRQVFLYPALYLPYLPYKTVLVAFGLLGLALFFVFKQAQIQISWVCYLFFLPPIIAILATRFASWHRCMVKFLANIPLKLTVADIETYGPLGSAILHSLWHTFMRGQSLGIRPSKDEPYTKVAWGETLPRFSHWVSLRPKLPHLILIQEESFADPRQFATTLPKDILTNFDRLSLTGYLGELAVRAYGAYTMRTEYEVLTGIQAKDLGTDAFHPYWSAAKIPSWSIANFLRAKGYFTVCVHPFAKSFFYRNLALPNMGFDHFISLENFPIQEKFGPYISDKSVAQVVLSLVQDERRPVFCFVITMENHGPWLDKRLLNCPKEDILDFKGLDPRISRYVTHIHNADKMLDLLTSGLQKLRLKSFLGIYGDHLPGLAPLIPANFRDTPCLLWGSTTSHEQLAELYKGQKVFAPAELGGLLLAGMMEL